MSDEELKIALECVRIHRGAVAMMGGESFHMAVINARGDIIGTVRCDSKKKSKFYAV